MPYALESKLTHAELAEHIATHAEQLGLDGGLEGCHVADGFSELEGGVAHFKMRARKGGKGALKHVLASRAVAHRGALGVARRRNRLADVVHLRGQQAAGMSVGG